MSESRFIPSIAAVQKAATKLPDADSFKNKQMDVVLDDLHSITFHRLKIKDARGKGYRWVYEGKTSVD